MRSLDWFEPLRVLAREQAWHAAMSYMATYAPSLLQRSQNLDLATTPLVVGGHQPELFHTGVWFKNFLLHEVATATHSAGLHVIIDHDIARSDSLRVPLRFDQEFQQQTISLPMRSDTQLRMPWHLTQSSSEVRRSWPAAIAEIQKSLESCGLENPLIVAHSGLLDRCLANTNNVGDAFSQFRHGIEIARGIRNAEVPMSLLCEQSAFGSFVMHCVANAESLWHSYNTCRNNYRTLHAIRNHAQPVPELLKQDACLELPFWIYQPSQIENVDRRRMWIDNRGTSLELCDHPIPSQRTISVVLPADPSHFSDAYQNVVNQGICIRPRALMTTMYLRCFVADLFVHGIGGGAYDVLTDQIIQDWLGITPPRYLTCSASLHLPIQKTKASQENALSWTSLQREQQLLRSAPERFLDVSRPEYRELGNAHRKLLEAIPERGKKRHWHREISLLKQSIDTAIEAQKRQTRANIELALKSQQQDRIVRSREYSFVLFPENDILPRLSQLAQNACRE